MNRVMRRNAVLCCVLVLGAHAARAEEAATGQEAIDPAQAAMQKAMELGSPSDGHAILEPLVGTWTYTMQMWVAPESEPQSMDGAVTNTLVFGGRFLKQEVRGNAAEDFPAFEGLGYLGYDNIRQEYQTVWLDNMNTGTVLSTGTYDAAAKTLTSTGDISCPMTGEAHRKFRDVWTLIDADHSRYDSYATAADGTEYKAMEIHYTRAQ